jgi:hypothetical protein
LPFAATPLLFAAQQVAEGVLWHAFHHGPAAPLQQANTWVSAPVRARALAGVHALVRFAADPSRRPRRRRTLRGDRRGRRRR